MVKTFILYIVRKNEITDMIWNKIMDIAFIHMIGWFVNPPCLNFFKSILFKIGSFVNIAVYCAVIESTEGFDGILETAKRTRHAIFEENQITNQTNQLID